MTATFEYSLTIGLYALNHLGLNLYSNIPAVISEAVANSYDADATVVEIEIDTVRGVITVTDDGCGMTRDECNSKYLNVGYPKRERDGISSPKYNRHFMGRKGIGKLSLFSIAKTIEVHTVKRDISENVQKNGFIMDADEIRENIRSGKQDCPLPSIKEEDIKIEKGTRIILRNLKKDLSKTEIYLRKRLARRFSIIGEKYNFSVILNGMPITMSDRNYFEKLEYLWYIGDYGKECAESCTNLKHEEELAGIVDETKGYNISGWVGTFDERKSIEPGNNTIVVLSWGKSIHEDILKDIDEGGIYSKYIIGEIHANFLDLDDDEDIATSDRQSVKEDDPRFEILKNHVRKILKIIQNKWTELRTQNAVRKALENEKIKEWFESLKGDTKKYARQLFMKIEEFPIEDPEFKKTLYKHGILAFQYLVLRENLSALDGIKNSEQFDTFIILLSGMDQIEALHYHEIVKNRIGILEKFETILPDSRERILQEYIFDHLWLLDPSWERADTTSKRIEESVLKEFEYIDAKLTPEEKDARIDIRYKTAAGKHIIIELKKYDVKVDIDDLTKQVRKYKNALSKCLETMFPDTQHQIEIICILGYQPRNASEDEISRALDTINARYITYDRLIKDALSGYNDYLAKQKEINKLQTLIDTI